MGSRGISKLFVLLLGISFGSAYIIPSDDIVADVQIFNLENPATIYFTYRIDKLILGNSVQFPVSGSTADGNKRLIIEPARGGPKTKYVRQTVSKSTEGGKPVITLVIKSTVRNIQRKIKYSGLTTITYKAHTDVQWYVEHQAVGELGYEGEGCDPDDVECGDEAITTTPRQISTNPPPTPDPGPAWASNFKYNYAVQDDPSANFYSNIVDSDGDVTRGEYRTLLPDGQTQVVSYTADWKNGYLAKVTYEGDSKRF